MAQDTQPILGIPANLQNKIQSVLQVLNQVIHGKSEITELMLVALLAQGHVLLEDIPGIGKTTLAKAFARSIQCQFHRIQFTPDLMPSDVIGTMIYHPSDQGFHFQEGPVFTQILMADEINRASPRTQSSLLEAMAEAQVTVDGQSRSLGPPFMVLATQNPSDYQGTYPLPEAQLDRFMMRLEIGYPNPQQELEMLFSQLDHHPLDDIQAVLGVQELLSLQQAVLKVNVHQDIAVYLLKIIEQSRSATKDVLLGISPRGSLALFQAARARALLKGRNYVIPEDIHALSVPVLAHRLILRARSSTSLNQSKHKIEIMRELLQSIPVPFV